MKTKNDYFLPINLKDFEDNAKSFLDVNKKSKDYMDLNLDSFEL